MNHLILCREYAPAPYPPGGIGTYVRHIAALLAGAGDTVHVIAQRWYGAPLPLETLCDGRLHIHRVALDESLAPPEEAEDEVERLGALARSSSPAQVFSWQAMRLAEWLVGQQPIDLIEAQEWEAPLYYFQLRRALGRGPKSQPPCLVHLHSPTEVIFRHNEWDPTLTDFLPTKRLEDFTILSADALACPSAYLARQVEEQFSLPHGYVNVVRYPVGDNDVIERSASVWAGNKITYVGRLELRKGIIEWIDAAAEVARKNPTAHFELFGADTSEDGGAGLFVRSRLMARIPAPVRERFAFRGSQPSAVLREALANSCAAVVPARWENLPYSCMESMASGLPVLASPTGGMKELVRDGVSGWIARDSTSAGLADALRRLLETPPQRRAEMGAQAAADVRLECSNQKVLADHLTLRAMVMTRGVVRSNRLPVASAPGASSGASAGIGVVVLCGADDDGIGPCLSSLRQQTHAPVALVAVVPAANRGVRSAIAALGPAELVHIVETTGNLRADMLAGRQALLAIAPELAGLAFLYHGDYASSVYLGVAASVLQDYPHVGIVSSWWRESADEDPQIRPTPAMPYQWLANDVGPHAVFRTGALRVHTLSPTSDDGDPMWHVANELVLAGWGSVTFPEVLVETSRAPSPKLGLSSEGRARAHRYLEGAGAAIAWYFEPNLARARELNAARPRYSLSADAFAKQHTSPLQWFLRAPLREKLHMISRAAQNPAQTARWVGWRVR
ncbi:MAG: glycosyltransferase family 4 protein [bacterium]